MSQFDAADEEAVKKVVKEAVDTYGHLDAFFANAGVLGARNETGRLKMVGEIETGEFMDTFRVNTLR